MLSISPNLLNLNFNIFDPNGEGVQQFISVFSSFAVTQRRLGLNKLGVQRPEMEELSPVRRQIKVEASLQVSPAPFKTLLAEEIGHLPVARCKSGDFQRYVALAGMRSEVCHDKIKLRRLRLPLNDNEVLGGGIFTPGWRRF